MELLSILNDFLSSVDKFAGIIVSLIVILDRLKNRSGSKKATIQKKFLSEINIIFN